MRSRTPETVTILNPRSGGGDHAEAVRERADALGYGIETVTRAGEAVTLARDAAEAGATTVVAAGGDGTIHEVVQGIDQADAFGGVTLGVVPAGTGNNFAKQIGVTDLDTAFAAVEEGERRRIDLGDADGRSFVNSCVAGLTADSSDETSPELKKRFGVLAYVATTLRTVSDFEAPRLTVESIQGNVDGETWTGDALCVMVGNARRFRTGGGTQANVEDGHFDMTIVESVSTLDLMSDTLVDQLLGQESASIRRSRPTDVTITTHDSDSVRFSLDGEMIRETELALHVRPRTLSVAVGETYEPDPDRSDDERRGGT